MEDWGADAGISGCSCSVFLLPWMQELRDMAAASLIAFELSSEEGPAFEVGTAQLCCSQCACCWEEHSHSVTPGLQTAHASLRVRDLCAQVDSLHAVLCCAAQVLRTPPDLDVLASELCARLTAVLCCQVRSRSDCCSLPPGRLRTATLLWAGS